MTRDILLIGNDLEWADLLREYLCGDNLSVDAMGESETMERAGAIAERYRVALIDGSDDEPRSLEILRTIRQSGNMPVLLLTGLDDPIERVRALEIGADDCLTKSCDPFEVSARLRAMLRLVREADSGTGIASVTFVGALAMWSPNQRAEWNGKRLDLTVTEFRLLGTLASSGGRPVSKQELSQRALGRPYTVYDRNIDICVSTMSSKLDAATSGHAYVEPVFRQGYQLVHD